MCFWLHEAGKRPGTRSLVPERRRRDRCCRELWSGHADEAQAGARKHLAAVANRLRR